MKPRRRRKSSSEQDARVVEAIVVPRYAAHFARLFLPRVSSDARMVLDVGCGTGHVSFHVLARLGSMSRVIAIDTDEGLVDIARRRGWDEIGKRLFFKVESADALSFGDGVFDAVVGNLVLPELEHPAKALAEMRRVLVPGGELYLTTPLRGTFVEALDMLREIAVHDEDNALASRVEAAARQDPDPEALETELRDAGYEDVVVHCDEFRISFRSAEDMFADRLVQVVGLPLWRELAGDDERADARLARMQRALHTYFAGGALSLTVRAGCAYGRRPGAAAP